MNSSKYFVTELKTPHWTGKCVVLERFVAVERTRLGKQRMDFVQLFRPETQGSDYMPSSLVTGNLPDNDYSAPVANTRNLTDVEKAEILAALA